MAMLHAGSCYGSFHVLSRWANDAPWSIMVDIEVKRVRTGHSSPQHHPRVQPKVLAQAITFVENCVRHV